MASPSQDSIYLGDASPQSFHGEYNRLHFIIWQQIRRMQTSTLVRIENVENAGELSPVGFVDVLPLLQQEDANGKTIEQGTIFQMFQRLEGHRFSGTGIGLATCKKIVERHKGRIEVESNLGEGTEFIVTLPLE